MSKSEPRFLLEDILECAEKIQKYTQSTTYADFAANNMIIDVVIRNFEVIGEASNRLPDELKDNAANIDWYKIRGLRNRIAHHYFGLDFEIIWDAVEKDIPHLIEEIKTLLA